MLLQRSLWVPSSALRCEPGRNLISVQTHWAQQRPAQSHLLGRKSTPPHNPWNRITPPNLPLLCSDGLTLFPQTANTVIRFKNASDSFGLSRLQVGVCGVKNGARVNDSLCNTALISLSCLSFTFCHSTGWFSKYLSFCLGLLWISGLF